MQIRRILVPVDFSSCSSAALEWAADLAERMGASVDLLHVWDGLYHRALEAEPLAMFAHSELAKEMEVLLTNLESRGIEAHGRLEQGSPREAIVRCASEWDYDLIIMGTHGRTGLAHFILGSVAENVVRRAPCPVLTTRATRESLEVSKDPFIPNEERAP
jgi:nucleotide-binding universal stress UspA family protein